jgi:hypothetical protein
MRYISNKFSFDCCFSDYVDPATNLKAHFEKLKSKLLNTGSTLLTP